MVDDDLDLTAAALRRYGTKLYVLGDVTVSADCIATLGKLEFFHASGTVTLPQEAEETFCAIPDLAYDELRVLSGHLFSGLPKLTLTPDLLAQYPEGIACVDCAMVRLDPALLPDEIAKHCQFDGCQNERKNAGLSVEAAERRGRRFPQCGADSRQPEGRPAEQPVRPRYRLHAGPSVDAVSTLPP